MSQGERLNSQALIRPIVTGEQPPRLMRDGNDTQAIDKEYNQLLALRGLSHDTIAFIAQQVLSGALTVPQAQSMLQMVGEQASRGVVEIYTGIATSDETAGQIIQSLIERDPQTGEIKPRTIANLQEFAREVGEISGERPASLMRLSGPDAIAIANLASSRYLRQVEEVSEAMGGDEFAASQALMVEGDFSDAALYEVAMRVDDLCMQTTFTEDEVAFISELIENPELVARIIQEYPDMEDRLIILQGY